VANIRKDFISVPFQTAVDIFRIFCLGPAACYTSKATLRENSDFPKAEPHVKAAPHDWPS